MLLNLAQYITQRGEPVIAERHGLGKGKHVKQEWEEDERGQRFPNLSCNNRSNLFHPTSSLFGRGRTWLCLDPQPGNRLSCFALVGSGHDLILPSSSLEVTQEPLKLSRMTQKLTHAPVLLSISPVLCRTQTVSGLGHDVHQIAPLHGRPVVRRTAPLVLDVVELRRCAARGQGCDNAPHRGRPRGGCRWGCLSG